MEQVQRRRVAQGRLGEPEDDWLAVEEPLEIRLEWADQARSVAITMRTPGHDIELALGFLYTEHILTHPAQVSSARGCGPRDRRGAQHIARVALADGVEVALGSLERSFYTTSSCGICGKASLDAVQTRGAQAASAGSPQVSAAWLHTLPERLREAQVMFAQTGGLHGCGLFDLETGELVCAREDVGRHNALDKLIGWAFEAGLLPLERHVLMLSGRISFELVQKALAARIPVIAAVGAPSTLAVELAARYQMTLVGFVRGERYNVYCDAGRLV